MAFFWKLQILEPWLSHKLCYVQGPFYPLGKIIYSRFGHACKSEDMPPCFSPDFFANKIYFELFYFDYLERYGKLRFPNRAFPLPIIAPGLAG
jgi:hypothetical protein